MSLSKTGHTIKYWRERPKDRVLTPNTLAEHLCSMVPIRPGESALDPFRGEGAFSSALKTDLWCEIEEGRDFFGWSQPVDWVVSNPPYSILDDVLRHTFDVAKRGFAYLLAVHAITPRRIENAEARGFGLARIHLLKVFKWYGISAFAVFERGVPSVVTYDRKVWRGT